MNSDEHIHRNRVWKVTGGKLSKVSQKNNLVASQSTGSATGMPARLVEFALLFPSAESFEGVLLDLAGQDWQGALLYAAGNSSDIMTTGGSTSSYTGTAYAPSSHCALLGNEENYGVHAQVICDSVAVVGMADMSITYPGGENYRFSSTIDLSK